jgi:hypothetical protein
VALYPRSESSSDSSLDRKSLHPFAVKHVLHRLLSRHLSAG